METLVPTYRREILLLNEKNKPDVSTIVNLLLFLHQNQLSMEKEVFRLVLTSEAENFIENLPQSVADKIYYNIYRVAKGERNKELFKKLDDTDIWEFRTLYNRIAYRLFAFWDKDKETMVIATHGIIKKTQKTPNKEIAKAEAIRKQYFKMKDKNNK